MNTVKLTLNGSNLDIEYHGSDLIPTASLNLDGNHDLRKLIAEMAEWCSRRSIASTKGYSFEEQMAHYPDPPPEPKEEAQSPSHQQRHQEAQERDHFNPWKDTKSAPNHLGDGC